MTQHALGTLRPVEAKRLLAVLHPERAHEAGQSEQVVRMEVREEQLAEGEARAVPHHLALGPFPAIEQNVSPSRGPRAQTLRLGDTPRGAEEGETGSWWETRYCASAHLPICPD
jgi:hypothetical protein